MRFILSIIASLIISSTVEAKKYQVIDPEDKAIPDHIYIEDGIQYVNSSKRNDTMNLIMKQEVSK